MSRARIITILVTAAAVAVFFGSITGFFIVAKRNSEAEKIFCTQEAKQCPDGSFVGRTGPKCEFAACPTGGGDSELFKTTGVVAGRVSVGPLCPVEPCDKPVGDIYSSRSLIFTPENGKEFTDLPFVVVDLNVDGTFRFNLSESDYSVMLTDCQFMGCDRALPKFIHVAANATTTLEIAIDTGIR